MTALEPRPAGGWDPDKRARALAPRRQYLLDRLTRKLPQSDRLGPDAREWVVDDAIEFAALHYRDRPIHSRAELERVFWNAADRRVQRAADGRHEIVRGKNNRRVDLAALEELAVTETPEDEVLALAERTVVLQFSALLAPDESDVFWCQRDHLDDPREFGATGLARELDMPIGTVRKALRAIEAKRERFAIIYTAGRLCGYLAPGVATLAAEHDNPAADPPVTGTREFAARVHLQVERCPTCIADYARHLRYLRGARFHTKVAALLPAPEIAERARTSGLRDLLPDWAARAITEPAGTAAQLAAGGAGRGLATTAAAHLAAFCLGGAGTLGACIATGVLPPPVRDNAPAKVEQATPTPTPTPRRPSEPEPRLRHGIVTATPTPTATAAPRRKATPKRSTSKTQGGTGPRSHEQTPASPAPANAAPNGASEFDPTYQPSQPAPAPVPAAPGANEFF
ncbi:hypothetical protein DVA67_011955 [Solirubrobacter sp. CPCC 204708]|uniref:Sigma-70 family RNA polymerase sigma factor n=1 Tax=Solirubrobacter deserti TaxID=2282478 RepID=A0ABT4RLK0_9ACTN|nr:hypothetical protein [Solirubrobacter deserti]MBE2316691.1 hypothetical protein [Solirubrobacter deserti]MDA0139448.1 hypothetical protein [Solirubrobacter deserti]